MSDDQNSQGNQGPVAKPSRQPIFLLPWPITALCGLLLAIELASDLVLNDDGRALMLTWLAFIPYRMIDPSHYIGGWTPLIWTSVTHAFLHAGWEHVGGNVVWLAIFGTPIAQRYGAVKTYALFLLGAAVGAWSFALTAHGPDEYLVGASGGIAALTGAAVRFIFQPPVIAVDEATGERRVLGRQLATLGQFVRNPTAGIFSAMWIVLNGIVPILPAMTAALGVAVAWQAHIGGFLAGLLLIPLFERRHI